MSESKEHREVEGTNNEYNSFGLLSHSRLHGKPVEVKGTERV